MKTNELKKVLKPLIKQCIKEGIFEEGVLSGIISEVVKGVDTAPVIREQKQVSKPKPNNELAKKKIQEAEEKMKSLDANYVSEYETRVKSQIEQAKKALAAYVPYMGDWKFPSRYTSPPPLPGTVPPNTSPSLYTFTLTYPE